MLAVHFLVHGISSRPTCRLTVISGFLTEDGQSFRKTERDVALDLSGVTCLEEMIKAILATGEAVLTGD